MSSIDGNPIDGEGGESVDGNPNTGGGGTTYDQDLNKGSSVQFSSVSGLNNFDPSDAAFNNYAVNTLIMNTSIAAAVSGVPPVDISTLEDKTQNIDLSTTLNNTNINGKMTLISENLPEQSLHFSSNTGSNIISSRNTNDFSSQNLTILANNIQASCPIINTGGTNPSSEFQVVNKGYVDTSITAAISNIPPVDLTALETKTQNQTAITGETIFTGLIKSSSLKDPTGTTNISIDNSDIELISSNLILTSGNITTTGTVNIGLGATNGITLTAPTTQITGDLNATTSINTTQYKLGGVNASVLKVPTIGSLVAGVDAAVLLTNGQNNIILGDEAGKDLVNGAFSVGVGYQSLRHVQNGVANVAIGSGSQFGVSGLSNGNNNVSVGNASLLKITTGNENSCFGNNAGDFITNGNQNSCLGNFAGDGITTGFGNTAIGANSLSTNGSNRTALGQNAQCDADNQASIGDVNTTQIINTGNNVCDLGSSTHKFKDLHVGGNMYGAPFDLIFAATDEVSLISTIGEKIQLRVPRNFITSKIKISVNTAGGAGFGVVLKKNGIAVATVGMNTSLVVNTASIINYVEDDTITLEVGGVGLGTASGLKCYMIGTTV